MDQPEPSRTRRSVLARAYRNENNFDFPRWTRWTLTISILLMSTSALIIGLNGLQLSMDFEGGSSWSVPSDTMTRNDIEQVFQALEVGSTVRVQEATMSDGERILRVTGSVDDIRAGTAIADALAVEAGLSPGDVTVSTIGPSWGRDITRQAAQSLGWFAVLVAGYLAWRLEPKMALAAMLAVLHDVLITVGIYSLFRIEISPATVIAFLTILGYSLYDTVVVFDRIQDSMRRYAGERELTFAMIMRRDLNRSLMRCVNTSITTILPIAAMLVVGGWVMGQQLLRDFSLVLLIGLALGVYSSLFVSAPMVLILKEREPRFVAARERMKAKGMDPSDTAWPTGESWETQPHRSSNATPTQPASFGHPPRPAKRRKRR